MKIELKFPIVGAEVKAYRNGLGEYTAKLEPIIPVKKLWVYP